jgi:uncharacterized protein YdeI (YjbR/CyaY-like superfamily)
MKRSKDTTGIDDSKLTRPLNPMPEFVERALKDRGVLREYFERPAYQQNDYIGWITQAKRQETKEKRLRQMLDELERGGVYMNMEHPASKKP